MSRKKPHGDRSRYKPHQGARECARRRAMSETGLKLAPGVYVKNGEIHMVIEELLADAGFADTPQNRQAMIDACRDLARREGLPFHES